MSCREPECLVPAWVKDTSFYQNNPGKFNLAVSSAHRWFSRAWLAEVEAVRAAIRALPAVLTYACIGCGRYAFPEPGVLCFWCGRRS